MWRTLFSAPWVERAALLPGDVQQQAAARINAYWRARGWQLALGEVVLWMAAVSQQLPFAPIYGALAMCIALIYLFGFFVEWALVWLISIVALLLIQGLIISGLGAVTALALLIPYTLAALLFSGRRKTVIQVGCIAAFWISLLYEVLPVLRQLHPPGYLLVSYNILLAAFVFQTMQFLNHLAVEINSAYVAAQVRAQSQQFLARVSHELRTPLNSVIGFAKLLRRGELNATQHDYLQQIIDESAQLNRLVSDLLDSAHLHTGKLTLNRAPCDINLICRAVADEQRALLPADVVFKLELSDTLPMIDADAVRVRQIVANLVGNAVKYTARGEIALSSAVRDQHMIIAVKDTGIGIDPEQHALIFVPFVQLDNRRTGVGLGLDIALQLARLHGGDIRVESDVGTGSTFTLELPLAPKQADVMV
jgi:signal transduction histidine kinase